ncbi:MAG: NIPSNAP family protein [Actinomycetota bacterium]
MILNRWSCEIRYGYYREVFDSLQEVNDLCKQRGLKPMRFWLPIAGPDNRIVGEIEYADLAEYDREQEAFLQDADIMKAVRKGSEYVVQGTSHTEVLMSATQIA